MKFYRRLLPFSAISFDLDDTLYSNYPVMMATDANMVTYFQQHLPPLLSSSTQKQVGTVFDYRFWFPFRQQVLLATPSLQHDVGLLRIECYRTGLIALGLSDMAAEQLANNAFEYFTEQRSDFSVPENVHQLLSSLKLRWPLIAISNGNVDTKKIGIAHYFDKIYHSNQTYRQKPCADMFNAACDYLKIEPHQLLHVGDCGHSDINGAMLAGCQSAWVSTYDVGKPLSVLPNIELSNVVELSNLL